MTTQPTLATPPAVFGRVPGRSSTLPEMAITTDRRALPSDLGWSGEYTTPKIGDRVDVTRSEEGTGTVVGYYHAREELGVLVELDALPEWLADVVRKGTREVHLWGEDIVPLNQGDDAPVTMPMATGTVLPVATTVEATASVHTNEATLAETVTSDHEEDNEDDRDEEDERDDEDDRDEEDDNEFNILKPNA